jgi:hypothetical protein
MKRSLAMTCRRAVSFGVFAILVAVAASAAFSNAAQDKQQKPITQTAGVDNTKMGAYRALAQLSFQAFQKGDIATAAELSRVLERTWDAAEEGGGDNSLGKTNSDLFEQIDKAMDVFIKPIINHAKKAPDPAEVEAAYNDYVAKLKQGDQ